MSNDTSHDTCHGDTPQMEDAGGIFNSVFESLGHLKNL